MKFLATHHQVADDLRNWAGGQQPLIAQYYFRAQGTEIQKSLEGLLRSLLFQTLRRFPDLIDVAFPKRDWLLGGPRFQFPKESMFDWLKRIISKSTQDNLRLCYFIDGLDEFDGRSELAENVFNPRELLRLLELFRNSTSIKLCISSRPWNEFVDAFRLEPSRQMVMQDLTQEDIKKYVHDMFMENENFMALSHEDSEYMQLKQEIVDAVDGVFLWVRLAVEPLLDGIRDGDLILTLKQKLHRLPNTLERMYGFLLGKLSPDYQRRASRPSLP